MIYLVEDDASIRKLVVYALESQGYEAQGFDRPSAFWSAMERQLPELVLLDRMLPEEDGIQILTRLRNTARTASLPVILLTALNTEFDRVEGLDAGADDYISKPYRPRELVSRIRSVLRRNGKGQSVVKLGGVSVDTEKCVVTKDGEAVPLSALEFRLLMVFINNRGKLLSRTRLLDEIWDAGGDFVNDNTLTVYIKRLREKIEDDPSAPAVIKTVRGLGYRVD